MDLRLPDISSIDFNDPRDVGGFVSLLCQAGSELGMFTPDFKPTGESNQLRQTANRLVRELDNRLPNMSVAQTFTAITSYDVAHRLAYNVPADPETIARYVLAAFNALIHGDASVDEYDMYREISRQLRLRNRAFYAKPLIWLGLSEERWYRSVDDPDTPDYDRISQAAILLGADLSAYEGRNEQAYKQELFERNRHYLDSPLPSSADPRLLSALSHLLNASYPYLTPEEATRYQAHLNTHLLHAPKVNRFMREVLERGKRIILYK